QLRSAIADQVRKYLPLLLPGQVWARRWRRQVELGSIARVLRQALLPVRRYAAARARIAPKRFPVKRLVCLWVPASRPQSLSALLVVDDDRPDQHVMQEPATIVEKCDQQDKRRKE